MGEGVLRWHTWVSATVPLVVGATYRCLGSHVRIVPFLPPCNDTAHVDDVSGEPRWDVYLNVGETVCLSRTSGAASARTNLGDEALLDHKVTNVPRAIRAPAEADEGCPRDRVNEPISSQKVAERGQYQRREVRRSIHVFLYEPGSVSPLFRDTRARGNKPGLYLLEQCRMTTASAARQA